MIKAYSLSEASQDLTGVLDMAEQDGAVIEREDGSRFQIMPTGRNRTPSEGVRGLNRDDIPLEVILEAVRAGRE